MFEKSLLSLGNSETFLLSNHEMYILRKSNNKDCFLSIYRNYTINIRLKTTQK